ncbi:MAG: serine/threonine-protein kinase [Planctomycetaceae bacterium]
MVVANLSEFGYRLIESGLLREQQVRDLLNGDTANSEPAEFAKRLVARRLLTRWQADKVLKGRHRGFFLGPYRLLAYLARGGMSTLYVAQHLETEQIVALKILPPSRAGKASYLPRFLREARVTAALSHPNIMKVFEVLQASDGRTDVHFMAMELLTGRDLFQTVSSDGPLPLRLAADVIRQAANGLQHAHSSGLVHRDVKPGNLFVTTSGLVKVLDLGLAGVLEETDENVTRNHNERVLGTADYLAPEQAIDSHLVDERADVYGLGCTLYFALTGRPPFPEGSLAQRLLAHQTKAAPCVRLRRSDVPEPLAELVAAMLTKKREDRIQSAAEVAARLEDWLANDAEETGSSHPEELSDMIDSSAPLALHARRLRRIRPVRFQPTSDSPTRPCLATDSPTAEAVPIQARLPEETPASELSDEEFETFLEALDPETGVRTLVDDVDSGSAASHPTVDSPSFPDELQNSSPHHQDIETAAVSADSGNPAGQQVRTTGLITGILAAAMAGVARHIRNFLHRRSQR